MGVLHGRDLLSTKYLTAIIIDSVSGAHFVPIKHEIGYYFFARINDDLYAFDTRGEQFTYRQTLVKSFRFIVYFTDCFKPVSQYHKELEQILVRNNLPKMDRMMLKFLTILGRSEKKKFENHTIMKLIAKLEERKDEPEYQKDYRNLIQFIKDLEIEYITTPVRRVTESVTGDFIIPDAKFMASIRSAFEILDREDKIINNVPIGAKIAWAKWIAVIAIIGIIGLVAYMAYSNGWFDFITGIIPENGGTGFNPFGGFGNPQEQAFMQKYPTTAAARAAYDAGTLTEAQIPPGLRDTILKAPKVTASP